MEVVACWSCARVRLDADCSLHQLFACNQLGAAWLQLAWQHSQLDIIHEFTS